MIRSCRKCGAAACVCGFLAAVVVALAGDGKPPPARTAAAFASVMPLSTSSGFTYVSDEVTGALRLSVWPEGRTREAIEQYAIRALQPTGPLTFKPEVLEQMAGGRAASSGDD
jgi:hypothetical protein